MYITFFILFTIVSIFYRTFKYYFLSRICYQGVSNTAYRSVLKLLLQSLQFVCDGSVQCLGSYRTLQKELARKQETVQLRRIPTRSMVKEAAKTQNFLRMSKICEAYMSIKTAIDSGMNGLKACPGWKVMAVVDVVAVADRRGGGGARNMKYKPLCSAAIFFGPILQTRGRGHGPPCPPPFPGSAAELTVWGSLSWIDHRSLSFLLSVLYTSCTLFGGHVFKLNKWSTMIVFGTTFL